MKLSDRHGSPALDAARVLPALQGCADRLRGLPVLLAYLHGAHARGEPGPLSDIDVAVLLRDDGSASSHLDEVAVVLEEALAGATDAAPEDGAAGLPPVDLALLNTASPLLRFRVIEQGRLFFSISEKARIDFEMRAQREYWDTAWLRRFHGAALARRIREGRFLG